VEAYLNDKTDHVELRDVEEAQAYMSAMKDFYISRMKEYITELNGISNKLKKYEDILAKRFEFFLLSLKF
jgi:kinesin family member 6/9